MRLATGPCGLRLGKEEDAIVLQAPRCSGRPPQRLVDHAHTRSVESGRSELRTASRSPAEGRPPTTANDTRSGRTWW